MYYCPSHKYLTSYRKTILPNFFVRKMWFEQFFLPSRTHRVIWLWKYRHFCRKLACDSMCVWSTLHHIGTLLSPRCVPLSMQWDAYYYTQPKCHKSFADHHAWEFAMPLHVGMNPYWNSAPPLNVRIFAFQSNQKHELGRYSNYRKYVAN